MKLSTILQVIIVLALAVAFVARIEAVTFTTNTSISSSNTTYDGQDVIVNNCTLTIDGSHTFNSMQVINGGIVTHTQICSPIQHLTITHDVTIDTLSRFDASAKGYGSATGPGKGGSGTTYGAGAGYGGMGGDGRNNAAIGGSTYGSIDDPILFGSGGGTGGTSAGGAGGGVIHLTVNGTLTIEGRITANGANPPSNNTGGGSGGSIYLTVGTLAGAGAISANGGQGSSGGTVFYGGGGGGGRIAIYYETNSFIGNILATGNIGAFNSGAGTVFLKQSTETYGHLQIDNDNIDGAVTPITTAYTFTDITAANRGKLDISTAGAVTVNDQLIIEDRGFVYVQTTQTFPQIHILSGGELGHLEQRTGFNVIVTGDVIIDTGGAISVTGKGYGSATGPGKGGSGTTYGAGAGYGGMGGDGRNNTAIGGPTYGSSTEPVHLGSGGGTGGTYAGGAGGGAIRLMVNGTLTVAGQITANGANPPSNNTGGGSGGSIYLTVGTLAGAGVISANGGQGSSGGTVFYGGGGGGGRIAIYSSYNNFIGTVSVDGAQGAYWGQNGTIYYDQYTFGCGDALHPYPACDFNHDCVVGLDDFIVFAGNWLVSTAP